MSVAGKRDERSALDTTSAIVFTSSTGMFGSTAHTSLRTTAARAAGSADVRTTTVATDPGF